jgi:hypothetical protein
MMSPGVVSKRYLLNQNPLWHMEDFAAALRVAHPAGPVLPKEDIALRGYR